MFLTRRCGVAQVSIRSCTRFAVEACGWLEWRFGVGFIPIVGLVSDRLRPMRSCKADLPVLASFQQRHNRIPFP